MNSKAGQLTSPFCGLRLCTVLHTGCLHAVIWLFACFFLFQQKNMFQSSTRFYTASFLSFVKSLDPLAGNPIQFKTDRTKTSYQVFRREQKIQPDRPHCWKKSFCNNSISLFPLSSLPLVVRCLILHAFVLRRCCCPPSPMCPPPSSASTATIVTPLSPPSLAACSCPSPS